MENESMAMLTYAMAHPFYYMIIQIKPPLIAVIVYVFYKLELAIVLTLKTMLKGKFK